MIFFFYGPNSFASRRKLREVAATYSQKTGSNFGLERIDGETADLKDLTAALLASPFLANSRLVIMERLSLNKPLLDGVTSLLERIPDSTVAVFYEIEIDQRSNYFKNLLSKAKTVKFDLLTPPQLRGWIRREVESLGGQIDPSGLSRLIELAGEDQWRLEQEIIKLVNFKPQITSDQVEALVEGSFNQSIFDLVEAMSAGQIKRALQIYRGLSADQTNQTYILTMVLWQLRNLLLAKTAPVKSAAELTRQAKLSPYVAGKVMERQRDFSEEVLRQAYLAGVDTEFALKTGAGQPDQLVERLILRVATLAAG